MHNGPPIGQEIPCDCSTANAMKLEICTRLTDYISCLQFAIACISMVCLYKAGLYKAKYVTVIIPMHYLITLLV